MGMGRGRGKFIGIAMGTIDTVSFSCVIISIPHTRTYTVVGADEVLGLTQRQGRLSPQWQ